MNARFFFRFLFYPSGWAVIPMILAVLANGSATADIFRHLDDKGVIHFTNVPDGPHFQLYIKENAPATTSKAVKSRNRSLAPTRATLLYLPQLNPHIETVSQQYGLDPHLIRAVIHAESNFDPWAVSPKGAQGLMQLMPQTARDLQVNDVFDPKENIDGGARYLRYLLDMYNQDMALALAAYNAGPERVNTYRGIPPFPETQLYVQKVLQIYHRLKSSWITKR